MITIQSTKQEIFNQVTNHYIAQDAQAVINYLKSNLVHLDLINDLQQIYRNPLNWPQQLATVASRHALTGV